MVSRSIHPSEMQTTSAASRPKGNTSEILKYAAIAAEILRDLTQASHMPFLQDAAGASLLLFGEINVRVCFTICLPSELKLCNLGD
jgi:hypothetical protein